MVQNHLLDQSQQSSIEEIVQKFLPQSPIANIQRFGSGNINDTFLISLKDNLKDNLPVKHSSHFILQRINSAVFKNPPMVMQNIRIYAAHVHDRLQTSPLDRRWEIPQILPTEEGHDYWQTEQGEFWRSLSFIEGSQSFDVISDERAREVGYALGTFHHLTSDLAPTRLADTLEGFHITPRYFRQYEEILAKGNRHIAPEVDYCMRFVSDRQGLAHILEDAKASGKLQERTIHGDPKVNNILFDRQTQLAVSMIDLDTVKSGLIHYDLGDCLRSGCNLRGEETEQWEDVTFEIELCQGILQGYLAKARFFLTEYDYAYIYDAIRVIAFELGLRFFTDYLAGNIYFHAQHPEHNLWRSLVQFRLVESIESQESAIKQIIVASSKLKPTHS
ncbi:MULTISPECIES: phosphotransferase enzyme family protein [Pseudanabaena]|uniref:Aminoglycoside phosphotransferase n=2 Tax=Pseudanabaena TaxID=1152 RepID=L8MUW3_9CYAN|nr:MULTISPECIES: aminoglycoside phosphotransferase family protein [Pseudanabaena]ELS30609.1 aminoglycoside phosphotransferase [Pseudanabaena biceps PCC 7429]MDG3497118.1 aminoglycoside phosphotransferase family protein [Pseudanabaena catenata USMAC16]